MWLKPLLRLSLAGRLAWHLLAVPVVGEFYTGLEKKIPHLLAIK